MLTLFFHFAAFKPEIYKKCTWIAVHIVYSLTFVANGCKAPDYYYLYWLNAVCSITNRSITSI